MTANRYSRVLVAIDGSTHSEEALAAAVDLSKRYQSVLTILTVAPLVPVYMPSGNSYMATPVAQTDTAPYRALVDAAVKKAEAAGVTAVSGVCEEGVVVDEILAFLEAHPVDLVVVGSRGMSAAKRLLIGSISSALVAHAPCPVLVVRGRPPTKPSGSR
jgi:nucleotide-binding universal stress UspA family protein